MKNNNLIISIILLLLIVSLFFNFFLLKNNVINNKELNNKELQDKKNDNLTSFPESISKEYAWKDFKKINLFEESYNLFKKNQSYEEYNNWYNIFWNELFLWFLIKLRDVESFKKFWLYKYEYYFNENDEDFINDMKKKSIKNSDDFSNYMLKYFDSLINSKITKLSDIDYEWWDIFISFNNLNISDAMEACKILKEKFSDKYLNDSNSCEDKIYNFRATSKNKYCEKISDPYKVRLCNDFLKYSNQ